MESSSLIKLLSKPAIEASIPMFGKLLDGAKQYLNDGLLDYFLNSLNKYQEIKTLLHRQPTNFYDIYYPTKLRFDDDIVDTISIKEIFAKSNYVTIIGDAGSGKSTLIKHLFINSFIESYKAPIFVALRDLDETINNPEQYLRNIILDNKLSPSDKYLNKLLSEGEFVFFLDGFDEINSKNKKFITSQIEKFIAKYPKNSYILTSRPYSNIEYFSNFYNYYINDLTKEDREEFIKKQILDVRLANKIIDSIKDNSQAKYIEDFLKNSLLLTLYIMSYSKNSSIPNSKYIFYMRVFDVLFAEHDSATKIGFEREIKTQLNQESIEDILKFYSYLSYFDSRFDFNKSYINAKLDLIKDKKPELKFNNNDFIEDMKLSIGLWVEDCGLYAFSHRSMQEYFSSLFLSKLKSEDNKKIIYTKIISLIQSKENFDFDNFLSLCYEMDSDSFIKYYLIPVLNKIRLLFRYKNGKNNYNFSYMNEGFSLNGFRITQSLLLLINTPLFVHKKFEYFITIASEKFFENKNHINFNSFIKIVESGSKDLEGERIYLPKNKSITPKYITFLKEIGMDEALNEVVSEIDNLLDSLLERLAQEQNKEDEIINLV